MQDPSARARKIKLLVLDVDGVLTDGRVYISDKGEECKAYNIRDGLGMKMLQECGVRIALISGRNSASVEARAQDVGIAFLYQGVNDKVAVFEKLIHELDLEPQQSAFMGDDLVDLPAMRRAGFALTVADAPAVVKERAHYVTRSVGGHGAVREACELIMQAQGTLEDRVAPYLE
ncbi:MAG TPA: 3-deoxy-manno-octulosonate-8-phosphatase KdsC [Burkholderiales bacterium]|jgi:3-deoxy-D-manno-octulosonate 8-phosphate phosphatase (KDO 8-P phosphatase)|nr:3-deoxy-manno-octulosonate-8-phosphatase KdsC [Burkholderiales bacterium]